MSHRDDLKSATQRIICKIIMLVILVGIVVGKVSDSKLVVDSLKYNYQGEFADSPSTSQPYYLVNYALDAPSEDICSEVKQNEMSSKYGDDLCTDYFCGCTVEANVCFNLTNTLVYNSTLRLEYFRIINYCLYCNSETSERFRNAIKSNSGSTQCRSTFPSYEQLMASTLNQCNGLSMNVNSLLSNESVHSNEVLNLGLTDWKVFQNSYVYRYKYLNNMTSNSSLDNSLHMFSTLFSNDAGPVLCWCRTSSTNSYRYQCNDAYHTFLLPLKYCAIPFILFILYSLFIILSTIYCGIPHFYCKVVSIREQVSTELMTRKSILILVILKHSFLEVFASDVKPMVLFFMYLSMTMFGIENLFSFLYNFIDFQRSVRPDLYWGVFRSFAIYFGSFSVCSLLVKWSHVVDLIQSKTAKKKLSPTNAFFLIVTYLFNIVIMFAGIVLSSVLSTSSYFFIVAAISMVLFPTIFFIGFTIYGAMIQKKINKTKSVTLYHLKFTKFILFFNSSMLAVIVFAFIFLPTFLIAWDIYGLFVGVFKNLVMDSVAMFIFCVVSYILFLDREFLDCYGDKARWLWPFTRDKTNYEPPQSPKSVTTMYSPRKNSNICGTNKESIPTSTTSTVPTSGSGELTMGSPGQLLPVPSSDLISDSPISTLS